MLKTGQRKPKGKIFGTFYFAENVGFYNKLKNRFQFNREINLPVHIHKLLPASYENDIYYINFDIFNKCLSITGNRYIYE
jgi:hypothetical protein